MFTLTVPYCDFLMLILNIKYNNIQLEYPFYMLNPTTGR